MACNQIMVLSRFEAEDFAWPYPWCCISIANDETLFASISRENRVGLLQVAFADITQPLKGFIAFYDSLGFDILDFVSQHWDTVDLLMVHCDAGISRSSAVAAAISRLKFGSEGDFLDSPFDPNPRVYRMLREIASGRSDFEQSGDDSSDDYQSDSDFERDSYGDDEDDLYDCEDD